MKMVGIAMGVAVLLGFVSLAEGSEAEGERGTAADVKTPEEGEVREAMFGGRKVKIVYEDGGWVLQGKTKGGVSTNDIAVVHKSDDVFLDINGEKLSWGAVDGQIDLLMAISPIKLPQNATTEDLAVVMATTRRKYAQKLLMEYAQTALLAQKGREMGLAVSAEEVSKAVVKALKNKKPATKKKILATASNADSYFYRLQENYLLTKKYCDALYRERVEIPAEEIQGIIEARKKAIDEAKAKNATLKPLLEGLLGDIRTGKKDFAEVVFDESDTPDDTETGEWGEFERDDIDEGDTEWSEEMRKFAFTSRKGEIGGVFETQDGYVVLKVLETDLKGGKEADVVTLARIVKEKFDILDELNEVSAMEIAQKREQGKRIAAAQIQAANEARIANALGIDLKARFLRKHENFKKKTVKENKQ